MSRRSPRIRARFAATVEVSGTDQTLVCRTRDVSADGCFLDSQAELAPGAAVSLAVMDSVRGEVVQVDGVVARSRPAADGGAGFGVRLARATPEWRILLQCHEHALGTGSASVATGHLAVLLVGDEGSRRGAAALYVTSGWDVRFATDAAMVALALDEATFDAVVVDYEPDDPRTVEVLRTVRQRRPRALRIICSDAPAVTGAGLLVQRWVNRDAGVDGLIATLAAEIPPTPSRIPRPGGPGMAATRAPETARPGSPR